MLNTDIYTIRALTNLHPGSGDNNYGIVDRLVQRDPTSNAPTIHASGIKGAIRQYFADQMEEAGHWAEEIVQLFGSYVRPNPRAADNRQRLRHGNLYFISADLLAIPSPDQSNEAEGPGYQLYHSEDTLNHWNEKVRAFQPNWTGRLELGIANKERFNATFEELPVIARNYLDNGESKNLWYEEVVPRESIFGMVVQGPQVDLNTLANGGTNFAGIDEKVVQIGANATVGYGYCLFSRINKV